MTTLRVMHDIADGQLMSADERRMGRVTDIGCKRLDDGAIEATTLALGPEATLRRIASRLTGLGAWLFGGRHERRIGLDQVVEFGPTLRLRAKARDYDLSDGDRWAARLLRWIPGSAFEDADDGRRTRAAARRGSGRIAVWISDLIGTPVVDEDGKRLGQVVELHIGPRHHRITEIMPGSAGWLDRLGLRPLADRNGRAARETIAWQAVMAVGKDRIVVRRSSLKGARRDR